MTYASKDIEEIVADIEKNRLQELQKARTEVLDELEYRLGETPFQIGGKPEWDRGVMFQWQGVKNWIAEQRDRYQSELE